MKCYFFILFAIVLFCIYLAIYPPKTINTYPIEKLTRGKASKTQFSGHSYVVWQQNFSDCIIHDPDCECLKKDDK